MYSNYICFKCGKELNCTGYCLNKKESKSLHCCCEDCSLDGVNEDNINYMVGYIEHIQKCFPLIYLKIVSIKL